MATQSLAFEGWNNVVASERYLSNRFVAVTSSTASRLAKIFKTPQENVQLTYDVKLLHRTELWAWWSDNKLTTTIGLPDNLKPKYLSNDAIKLIDKVCYSTKGVPSCSWAKLAKIEKILDEECIAKGILEVPEELKKLTVEYGSREQGILYTFRCTDLEDKERYFYDVDTVLPLELLKKSTISRLVLSLDEIQLVPKRCNLVAA